MRKIYNITAYIYIYNACECECVCLCSSTFASVSMCVPYPHSGLRWWWCWDNKLTCNNEYFKRFILGWAIIAIVMHLHALFHDIEVMCDKNLHVLFQSVLYNLLCMYVCTYVMCINRQVLTNVSNGGTHTQGITEIVLISSP